jgi:hypothetical protein
MGDHRNERSARPFVAIIGKAAGDHRRAKHPEQRGRNERHRNRRSAAVVFQLVPAGVLHADTVERRALASYRHELFVRERALRPSRRLRRDAVDGDETCRLGKRQRSEDDGVDNREDCGGAADAERQGENRGDREAAVANQEAQANPQILAKQIPMLAGSGPREILYRAQPETDGVQPFPAHGHLVVLVAKRLLHVTAKLLAEFERQQSQ